MNEELKTKLQEIVANHNIVLFMKGTPQMPQCGFSMHAANMLHDVQAEFHAVNVLENEELRQGIKEFSNWPTIPQLYVKGKFVGGCDIMKQLVEQGEFAKTLELD